MILNWVEFALMNNPLRVLSQRLEARLLLHLGGPTPAARVLELGCGRGVGAGLILDLFRARRVHAFDLDPRMIRRARQRTAGRGDAVGLFLGDGAALPVSSASYDAVFDFGIIHHVPDWRAAVAEVARVLKPGGRFYGEEVTARLIQNRVVRALLEHPEMDRFDEAALHAELGRRGLRVERSWQLSGLAFWFVARKA